MTNQKNKIAVSMNLWCLRKTPFYKLWRNTINLNEMKKMHMQTMATWKLGEISNLGPTIQ